MAELNLSQLMETAASENANTNAATFTELLKQIEKIINAGDKILDFINRAERSTLIGTALRKVAKDQNFEVGPLTKNDGAIIPKTAEHSTLMMSINQLNDAQLKELYQAIADYDQKTKTLRESEFNERQIDIEKDKGNER